MNPNQTTLKPGLTAWNGAMLALMLAILLGVLAWNGYGYVRPFLTFYQALTTPKKAHLIGSTPQRAEAWNRYLQKVSGLKTRFGPPDVDLINFYTFCLSNGACTNALNVYRKTQTPPLWQWYLVGLAVLPVFLIRATPKEATAPADGFWAKKKNLQEREEKPGEILGQKLHHQSTFIGLFDVEKPERVLEEEPKKYELLQMPSRIRNRHILVVAGTGAGKTTTYAMNQVFSAAVNQIGTIVFDQKWGGRSGLLEAVAIYMAHDRPVSVFTPFSDSTLRLPLLEEIPEDDSNAAFNFAQMVIPAPDNDAVMHYRENDWALLAGLIMAHRTQTRIENRPADLGEIVELLSHASIEQLKAYTEINPVAHTLALKIFERPPAKLSEAIPGLRNKILPFSTSKALRRATTKGMPEENLDLERLLQQPGLLYVGIPEDIVQTEPGRVILRLLKMRIDRAINKVGPLKHPYNFLLDEFANFGPLPNIETNLAMVRDQNVSFHIILQSMAQGVDVYGQNKWQRIVENNLNSQVWYVADLSDKVQAELAKYIGETTVLQEGVSESREGMLDMVPKTSYSLRAARKALLSPQVMARAPRGTAVVRLPNVGWTAFRAVTLQDPRNPFHQAYWEVRRQLPRLVRLLQIRKAMMPLNPFEASSGEQVIKQLPPSKPEVFTRWVERLIEETAPLKVYTDTKGSWSKIVLFKANHEILPPEVVEAGYVKVKEAADTQEVAITGKGLKLLGSRHVTQLNALNKNRSSLEAIRNRGLLGFTNEPVPGGALAVVDLPSQTVYIHASQQAHFEGLQPTDRLPSELAKKYQPHEWLILKGGLFMYGLISLKETGQAYARVRDQWRQKIA